MLETEAGQDDTNGDSLSGNNQVIENANDDSLQPLVSGAWEHSESREL